jgi:SRSO17 transposase
LTERVWISAADTLTDDITFLKTWEIALRQIGEALKWGVRPHVVLADAGYGEVTEFRDELDARKLPYLASGDFGRADRVGTGQRSPTSA